MNKQRTNFLISRLALIMAVISLLAPTLLGCSSSKAEIPSYTLRGLPDKGYFVRHVDIFYPIYNDGISFNTIPDITKLDGRFFWHIEENDYLIPRLSPGDELILRSVASELPAAYFFERFEDRGYTLGCAFTAKAVGFAFESNRKWLKDSSAHNRLNSTKNLGSYTVLEINSASFDPGLLDHNGMVTGLEGSKQYMLGAFEGTVYRELVMISDTRYYTSYAVQTVGEDTAPYALTRKGYAVITIPDGLQAGLYAVNGEGVFFINAN